VQRKKIEPKGSKDSIKEEGEGSHTFPSGLPPWKEKNPPGQPGIHTDEKKRPVPGREKNPLSNKERKRGTAPKRKEKTKARRSPPAKKKGKNPFGKGGPFSREKTEKTATGATSEKKKSLFLERVPHGEKKGERETELKKRRGEKQMGQQEGRRRSPSWSKPGLCHRREGRKKKWTKTRKEKKKEPKKKKRGGKKEPKSTPQARKGLVRRRRVIQKKKGAAKQLTARHRKEAGEKKIPGNWSSKGTSTPTSSEGRGGPDWKEERDGWLVLKKKGGGEKGPSPLPHPRKTVCQRRPKKSRPSKRTRTSQ